MITPNSSKRKRGGSLDRQSHSFGVYFLRDSRTPNTSSSCPPRRIGGSVHFSLRVKATTSVLAGLTESPCSCVQVRTVPSASCRTRATECGSTPRTRSVTSSAYACIKIAGCSRFTLVRRSSMTMFQSLGLRTPPCGHPLSTNLSLFFPLISASAVRFLSMKEVHQR